MFRVDPLPVHIPQGCPFQQMLLSVMHERLGIPEPVVPPEFYFNKYQRRTTFCNKIQFTAAGKYVSLNNAKSLECEKQGSHPLGQGAGSSTHNLI